MSRLTALVLLACCAAAAERRVDPAAPGPTEDGATWATAYRTLPAALAASASGDEVWIRAGTYAPASAASTFTVPDGVAVYGGFTGTETLRGQRADDPGLTILSGEIGAATETDNVHRVVTLPGSATLDTLTVTRAYWTNTLSFVGTAVYAYTTAPGRRVTLRRCRIAGNWAARSNAVYIVSSAVEIDRCEFTGNRDVLTGVDNATGGTVCILGAPTLAVRRSAWFGNQVVATATAASVLLSYGTTGAAVVENSVFAANAGFATGIRQILSSSGSLEVAASTLVGTAAAGSEVDGVAALRGCILSSIPASMPATVEGVWIVARDGDPLFGDPADPAGPDGVWFTADDGLIPAAGSPCRGLARMVTATADPAMPSTDLRGLGRPQGRDPEPGAYEIGEGDRGPSATAQAVSIREDVLSPIVLGGSDPDGDALSAWITALPAHGRLYPTGDGATASGPALGAGDLPWAVPWANTVLYRSDPDDNGSGRGSFAFLVDDGQVQSHPAAVVVDLEPVNDAPTIDQPADLAVLEDSGGRSVILTGIGAGTPGLVIGDPARESQVLSVTAVSSDPLVIPDPVVSYTSPAATAQLVFTPRPNANGVVTITVSVHDDGGTSSGGVAATVRAFTVTVQAVNDPPVVPALDSIVVVEDSGPVMIAYGPLSAGPPDEAGQTLEVLATSDNPSLVTIGGIGYDPATGMAAIRCDLAQDGNGLALIFIGAFDDGGTANGGQASAAAVFPIKVLPVDDPPALTTLRQLVCRAGSAVLITGSDLRLTDPDQPPDSALVYTLDVPPQRGEIRLNGTALGAGGTFTQADVLASRVAYWNTSINGFPLDAWSLTWSDGSILGAQGPAAVSVELEGAFAPNLYLTGDGDPWTDGGPPSAVAADAVIVDGDDPLVWTGGSVTVSIAAGAGAGDVLSLAHEGVGAGQIGVAGVQVTYGGTAIGTWSGGSGGAPLVVALTGATPGSTAAQAVVRAVRFASDRDPGSASRTVRFVVNDGILASAAQDAAVAVTPVDDPPVITTAWVATLAGVAREIRLTVDDPDSDLMVWHLGTSPAEADLTMVDATQGVIRIAPHPGTSGTTSFWAFVSDGVNNWIPAIIGLRITSSDEPRPHPATDAPAEAVAGERLSLDVVFDCTEIGGTSGLAFAGFGELPAGLVIAPAGSATVHVQWDVPAAEPAGVHRPFGIIATDPATHASGCWPVLLTVRPSPAGGG